KRAGIERVDALGRSVHFHSFRKTWQTLGVRYGINQRVAQEVLGHSDANLTAKVYTDVPALSLHLEIAKLPWIGAGPKAAGQSPVGGPATAVPETSPTTHTGSVKPASNLENAQRDAQAFGISGPALALDVLCAKFVEAVNVSDGEGFSHVLSSLVTSWRKDEMAARAGIEPVTK
ncbi:MAG: tyrosine-type recombinase/integrase, partial [Opitutaceae bacterium]